MPQNSIPRSGARLLSIEELEAGLHVMARGKLESDAFWDENVRAFRHTVIFAIRETADALLSSTIASNCRMELESQLEALFQYIKLADRYIACRSPSCEAPVRAYPCGGAQLH